MGSLQVVCWAYENRLDEEGGWGFSVHPDVSSAEKWRTDMEIRRAEVEKDLNGLSLAYVCGSGVIESPSPALIDQLSGADGIFIRNLSQEAFRLIEGKTPDDVTCDFVREMNDVPD